MSEHDAAYSDLISAKAKQAHQASRHRSRLGIAVLGPGLSDDRGTGAQKRLQIRDALKNDGHNPFFPEDLVVNDPLHESVLEQERDILSQPTVDLVIILYTSDSPGALMEIANFVSVPEIKAKTAILFPIEYYNPDDGLPGNTVREYIVRTTYTDAHFQACQLVSECRKWARDRATESWPSVIPHDV